MQSRIRRLVAAGELASPLVRRVQRHQALTAWSRAAVEQSAAGAALRPGADHAAQHSSYLLAGRAPDRWSAQPDAMLSPIATTQLYTGAHVQLQAQTPPRVQMQAGKPGLAAGPDATPAASAEQPRRSPLMDAIKPWVQRLLGKPPTATRHATPQSSAPPPAAAPFTTTVSTTPASITPAPAISAESAAPAAEHELIAAAVQPVLAPQPVPPRPAPSVLPEAGQQREPAAPPAPAASMTAVPAAAGVQPTAAVQLQPAALATLPLVAAARRADAPAAAVTAPKTAGERRPDALLPPATTGASPGNTPDHIANSDPATPPDNSQSQGAGLNWQRLTAILQAHQQQEQAAAPTGSVLAEQPTVQRTAQHTAQRTAQHTAETGVEAGAPAKQQPALAQDGQQQPAGREPGQDRHASSDPTAAPGETSSALPPAPQPAGARQPDAAALLQAAPPARATDSAVHVIAPRTPRPLQRKPTPGEAPSQNERRPPAAYPAANVPTILTEIGELPADLWTLIDETPPVVAAAVAPIGGDAEARTFAGQTALTPPAPAAPQAGGNPDAAHAAPTVAGAGGAVQRQPITVAEAVLGYAPPAGAANALEAAPSPLAGELAAAGAKPYHQLVDSVGAAQPAPAAAIDQASISPEHTERQGNTRAGTVTPGSYPFAGVPDGGALPRSSGQPVSGSAAQPARASALGPVPAASPVQRQMEAVETAQPARNAAAMAATPASKTTEAPGQKRSAGQPAGEPDVQELAALVYAELRRRLRVERERWG